MAAENRELTRCDQCGQTDDHPMIHFLGGRSVHHDCTSADEKQLVGASENGGEVLAIIALAESGVHGDKLLAKIEKGA